MIARRIGNTAEELIDIDGVYVCGGGEGNRFVVIVYAVCESARWRDVQRQDATHAEFIIMPNEYSVNHKIGGGSDKKNYE